MQDLAICLVSGGMDSLVAAAIAAQKHSTLAFLHVNYGQKTRGREQQCFARIAEHYGVKGAWCKTVELDFLRQIGGSSLTDEAIPVKKYDKDFLAIPDSYVPFRNTHIIAVAVSWAEVIGAHSIYIGAVAEDSSGYPDCRPSYYRAFNQLVKEGTKAGTIQVVTPVIAMSKAAIVQKAMQLAAPLELTWSCYQAEEMACGVCDSCVLRRRGFAAAGVKDPLEYCPQ